MHLLSSIRLFLGPVGNLPVVVYACLVTVSRPVWQSPHWIILGVIVWVFAQALSLSYGRSVGRDGARYLDLFIVALPLNFGVLLIGVNSLKFERKAPPRRAGHDRVALYCASRVDKGYSR